MSQVRRPDQSDGSDRLGVDRWMREVNHARDRLQRSRQARGTRAEEQQLRAELIAALEEYAGALAASGLPLPYRLRDELALYRRLGDRS